MKTFLTVFLAIALLCSGCKPSRSHVFDGTVVQRVYARPDGGSEKWILIVTICDEAFAIQTTARTWTKYQSGDPIKIRWSVYGKSIEQP